MALGLGLLRLSPHDFWNMAPRELAAALRFHTDEEGEARPDRAELDRLMQQFPDNGGRLG